MSPIAAVIAIIALAFLVLLKLKLYRAQVRAIGPRRGRLRMKPSTSERDVLPAFSRGVAGLAFSLVGLLLRRTESSKIESLEIELSEIEPSEAVRTSILVRAEKRGGGHTITVTSPMVLLPHHITHLLKSTPLLLHDRQMINNESMEYYFRTPTLAGLSDARALERVVSIRLMWLAVHDDSLVHVDGGPYRVWEVDSRPFPNPSTEVILELMRLESNQARAELQFIADLWKKEVHEDRGNYESERDVLPRDRRFRGRLASRIDRRLELLAWIHRYQERGLEAALDHARSKRWI